MNEAHVRIDIEGLESEDMESLSRMLALAGQAEQKAGGMAPSTVPPIAPLDFDSIGDETQAIMAPDDMNPADDMGDATLDAASDALSGSLTDFGGDEENVEMSLDMDGSPAVELPSSADEMEVDSEMEVEDDFDSHFDMDRMSDLAGIRESVQSEETDEDDIDAEADDEEEELDESLLPDLSLDEDSVASLSSERSEFGPFRSEMECVQDGQAKTNGYEGDNFVVLPKGDGFYWKRTVEEDVSRPAGECFDTDGIVHSRHNVKDKRNALGDNKLLYPVHESDESDDELEEIKESINAKFAKFMGGNNVQF